eukprot:5673674-Pleurochrysis_carterae.AAC.1
MARDSFRTVWREHSAWSAQCSGVSKPTRPKALVAVVIVSKRTWKSGHTHDLILPQDQRSCCHPNRAVAGTCICSCQDKSGINLACMLAYNASPSEHRPGNKWSRNETNGFRTSAADSHHTRAAGTHSNEARFPIHYSSDSAQVPCNADVVTEASSSERLAH